MSSSSYPKVARPGSAFAPGSLQRLVLRLARARIEIVVLVVGFVARFGVVLLGGGLRGNIAYDGAVYYAAADGLTFGRLPYRDFVLVHPPGIALVLAPFAFLGRLATDHQGFELAVVATMIVGALNAVLVVRIARRIGLGPGPAGLGGLFYALWPGAVSAEYVVRLEPIGNLFLLGGLLFLARNLEDGTGIDRQSVDRRAAVLAGICFAAAVSIKIWWIVPLAVVLAWGVMRRRWQLTAWTVAGAAAALVVVDGPFLLAAPNRWHTRWCSTSSAAIVARRSSFGASPTCSASVICTELWARHSRPEPWSWASSCCSPWPGWQCTPCWGGS